jgi:hypothetical protein
MGCGDHDIQSDVRRLFMLVFLLAMQWQKKCVFVIDPPTRGISFLSTVTNSFG